MKNVRVLIYGLFPTIFSTCAPCCPSDMLYGCELELEQLSEYPESIRRNQEFLVDVLMKLSRFGDSVTVEVVGADSLRGAITAFRYGLGSEPAIIVGKKVFKGRDIDIDKVIEYIDSLFMTQRY